MGKTNYYPPYCNCNKVEVQDYMFLVHSADTGHKGEDLKDKGTWSGENDFEEWTSNF